MVDITNIFGGAFTASNVESIKRTDPPEVQVADAMRASGLAPPLRIDFDGKVHRFDSDRRGDKACWYCLFGDGVPAGRFGNWKTGLDVPWKADIGRALTDAEEMANARRMAEAKALREAEAKRSQEIAADNIEKIWTSCLGADPNHPYLQRKGVSAHGARVTGDGRLVVPLYDRDGALSSLQYIDKDGGKLYHPNAKTGSRLWQVGAFDEPGVLYIAEGFATAATIYEETGRPCIVAYSASNLVPVTGIMREIHGIEQDLVIVADNDESGVGIKYADQASAKYGARIILSPEKGDVNDYRAAGGDLKALLSPTLSMSYYSKLETVRGSEIPLDFEAPDELIENLMTIGSMTVLYGDSNSGKTFFALSLATAVATGQSCYGRKVDPGVVVYLAAEAPGSIRSRMQAIKKHYGHQLENLFMVPVPVNFYQGDGDAHDVIGAVKEIEVLTGNPVRMIVADTLARISAGANENSGEDMGPVMNRFDQVARSTGAAMVIIHHTGKDAARGARGWSGIRAHIDTEIEVTERDEIRRAEVTKQRELPGKGEEIFFKLEVIEMGTTKFGSPATTCVAVPDEDGEEKVSSESGLKVYAHFRIIVATWEASGREKVDDLPYVSRSALKTYMESLNLADKTIINKLNTGHEKSIIKPMLDGGLIDKSRDGYVVIDPGCCLFMACRK